MVKKPKPLIHDLMHIHMLNLKYIIYTFEACIPFVRLDHRIKNSNACKLLYNYPHNTIGSRHFDSFDQQMIDEQTNT